MCSILALRLPRSANAHDFLSLALFLCTGHLCQKKCVILSPLAVLPQAVNEAARKAEASLQGKEVAEARAAYEKASALYASDASLEDKDVPSLLPSPSSDS
jgi:hypothetical protein